jgi:hypothetical protein
MPQNPIRHAEHIRRTEAIREANPQADAAIVANCLEVSEEAAEAYLAEIEAR